MATTDNDAMMRVLYRFIAMWLYMDTDTPAPHEVKLIDYDPSGGDRVLVSTWTLSQLKAWVKVFRSAGFGVTAVGGMLPGHGQLAVSMTGTMYGHRVHHLVILAPAMLTIPAELRDLVAEDASRVQAA